MAPELMNPMPGWSHTCVLERLTLGSSCTPRLLARYVFLSSAHIPRRLTVYAGAIRQRHFGPFLDQPPPLFGSHRCPATALHLSNAFHVLSIALDPAIPPLPSPPSITSATSAPSSRQPRLRPSRLQLQRLTGCIHGDTRTQHTLDMGLRSRPLVPR